MPAPRKGCFEALKVLYEGRLDFTKPFSLGLRDQILAEGKISRNRLKRALEYHCDSWEYLQAVLLGDQRYGLEGEVGSAITLKEKEHALKRIKKKITLERNRGDYFEKTTIEERKESKRHRKERKKINFDYGVMERKLKKMPNKYENAERHFYSFKKKRDLLEELHPVQAQNRAPEGQVTKEEEKPAPKIVVRKKRRVITPP